MKSYRTLVFATVVLTLMTVSGFVVNAETKQQAQTPVVKHVSTQKNTASSWFLHDVQLAERAKINFGINYILNYGETDNPFSPTMNQVWFGIQTNQNKDPFIGYSWSGMFNAVKTQPLSLSSINVLEQVKLAGHAVGVLVPATSDPIGNGSYIAFANGQVITAADKSGELFYSVYPVKGITVPSAMNQSRTTSASPNENSMHPSRLITKDYASKTAALSTIHQLQLESIGQFIPSGHVINLGFGIKAQYSKSGRDPFYYQWQYGRWTIITQFWGKSITPATQSVAKSMVAYLHAHSLPTVLSNLLKSTHR